MIKNKSEDLVRNLILLGSIGALVHKFMDRSLPKFVRKILTIFWYVRGKTFFYKSGLLPKQIVVRKFSYNEKYYLIECDLNHALDCHIAIHGSWEKHLLDLFRLHVKEGDTVIDIGSNIGFHTIILSSLVGKTGKVISVDPFPDMIEKQKRNVLLNKISNIEFVQKAVSDSNKNNLDFYIPKGRNKGLGSLQKNYDLRDSDTLRVGNISLDQFNNKINGSLSLIKIDVQGAELSVLKSGINIIKSYSPTILLEHEDEYCENPKSYKKELEELFSSLGYEMWCIHELHLYRFDSEQYFHGDILALPLSIQ